MIHILAHRGWSGLAPENTLAAFKLALTEPAIQTIELDVHLSKDGVPVVIHDATIDRTTNGNHYYFTRPMLEEMIELGIDIGVWTIDDPETLERLVGDYPDLRITTNYPDRLLHVLGQSVSNR